MRVLCIVGAPFAGKSQAAGYLEQYGWQLYEPSRIAPVMAQAFFKLDPFQMQGHGKRVEDPNWGATPAELIGRMEAALANEFGEGALLQRCLVDARTQGCDRVVLDGLDPDVAAALENSPDPELLVDVLVVTREGLDNVEVRPGWLQVDNPAPILGTDASWFQPFMEDVLALVTELDKARDDNGTQQ